MLSGKLPHDGERSRSKEVKLSVDGKGTGRSKEFVAAEKADLYTATEAPDRRIPDFLEKLSGLKAKIAAVASGDRKANGKFFGTKVESRRSQDKPGMSVSGQQSARVLRPNPLDMQQKTFR